MTIELVKLVLNPALPTKPVSNNDHRRYTIQTREALFHAPSCLKSEVQAEN